MNKYLTEFIGTFFLVLTICLCVLGKVALAPLAIGTTLMVMVYMGGHVSGAHYNPAVSLAVLIRGKLSAADFVPYLLAQIGGAIIAAFVASGIMAGVPSAPTSFAVAPGKGVSLSSALIVEILYTFALALVVLNVATARKMAGNSFYGLAIGFTVTAAAFSGGDISGGAFNPAVGIGPTLVNAILNNGSVQDVWIYLVAPLAGGALAALVFKIQEGEEPATTQPTN